MSSNNNIIIAAKCTPEESILSDIEKAGLKTVELYLSEKILNNLNTIIDSCKKFSLQYAVHAPNDSFCPNKLAELVQEINAGIVVFHDIFWEDEWKEIINVFKKIDTKLCLENISTVHEPVKFVRRYNFGMCLDLEHVQLECNGVYEEEFINFIRQASHIHLTGYYRGSNLWHTHIHHSPEHNTYLLKLLKQSGYSGFVVSEAKQSQQTLDEFKKLNTFASTWDK